MCSLPLASAPHMRVARPSQGRAALYVSPPSRYLLCRLTLASFNVIYLSCSFSQFRTITQMVQQGIPRVREYSPYNFTTNIASTEQYLLPWCPQICIHLTKIYLYEKTFDHHTVNVYAAEDLDSKCRVFRSFCRMAQLFYLS